MLPKAARPRVPWRHVENEMDPGYVPPLKSCQTNSREILLREALLHVVCSSSCPSPIMLTRLSRTTLAVVALGATLAVAHRSFASADHKVSMVPHVSLPQSQVQESRGVARLRLEIRSLHLVGVAMQNILHPAARADGILQARQYTSREIIFLQLLTFVNTGPSSQICIISPRSRSRSRPHTLSHSFTPSLVRRNEAVL
jgi:hypothetical protein